MSCGLLPRGAGTFEPIHPPGWVAGRCPGRRVIHHRPCITQIWRKKAYDSEPSQNSRLSVLPVTPCFQWVALTARYDRNNSIASIRQSGLSPPLVARAVRDPQRGLPILSILSIMDKKEFAMKVTSTDFQQNVGRYQDAAQQSP